MSMSLRALARTLGALSALLALVLVTAQSASAATRTMHDGTGDTYAIDNTEPDAAPVPADGPVGDIVWVRTAHRAKNVVVTIRVRELLAGSNGAAVLIKASKQRRPYVLSGYAGHGTKFVVLTKGVSGNQKVTCHGLRLSMEPRNDVIRASVPRSCLGDPRWVRTGTAVIAAASSDPDSDELRVDVGGMGTISPEWWASESTLPPLGPKVRVG